jgi:hypothetical protein
MQRLFTGGRLIEPTKDIPHKAYGRILNMLPLDARGSALQVFNARRRIQSELDQAFGRGMLRPTVGLLAKETSLPAAKVRLALRELEAISFVETARRKARRLPLHR